MTPDEYHEYQKQQYEKYRNELQLECTLFDITFDGETHQYVKWVHKCGNATTGSLSHWAGCKYCKNKKSIHRVDFDLFEEEKEDNDDDWLYN
jgi:hypothetical protein